MSDQADFSRNEARRAAKAAAADVLRQKKLEAPGSGGAFALYIWGALAIASVLLAGSAGLFPGGGSSTTIVAQNVPVRQPSPDIDPARELAKTNAAKKLALAENQNDSASQRTLSTIKAEAHLDQTTTGSVEDPGATVKNTIEIAKSVSPEALELGVDIGSASSIPTLVSRFSALQKRAPDLFASLEPRIQFDDSGNALAARLVAGPFGSQTEVAAFCRAVKLRLTIACEEAKFEGDKVALPDQ